MRYEPGIRRSLEPILLLLQYKRLANSKKLLPLIDKYRSASDAEGIESLFYMLSYKALSAELLGLIAEIRGRDEAVDKTRGNIQDSSLKPLGLPEGELILSYERLTQRWMKSDSNFHRLVKDVKHPMALRLVEEAEVLDTLNDNASAEVASLLIPIAFSFLLSSALRR